MPTTALAARDRAAAAVQGPRCAHRPCRRARCQRRRSPTTARSSITALDPRARRRAAPAPRRRGDDHRRRGARHAAAGPARPSTRRCTCCSPASPARPTAGSSSSTRRASAWSARRSTLTVRVEDLPDSGGERPGAPHHAQGWRPADAARHAGRPRRADDRHRSTMAAPTSSSSRSRPAPHELTLDNNRAALVVNGVRDRLRVLLVSRRAASGRAHLAQHPEVRSRRSISSISPSCARRRSRTARRSASCR